MSEATEPIGGSKEIKITETSKDLSQKFNFAINIMDFTVDDRMINDKTNETEDSGNNGDNNTTPIKPGNSVGIDAEKRFVPNILENPMAIKVNTIKDKNKSKESDKENDDRNEK